MSFANNPKLDALVRSFGEDAPILDVGGWYAPYPLATHVVDIMPYETRAQGVHPDPLPGERFTRETWLQLDITEPGFRLPFADDYFRFSVLRHTLEDLHEVRPIVRELSRVSRGGYIETPSRVEEQTIGVVDRACCQVGYNHHKWIVEEEQGTLILYDKGESFYQRRGEYAIPLLFTERSSLPRVTEYYWDGEIHFRLCMDGVEARRTARQFKAALAIPRSVEVQDALLRGVRRLRDAFEGRSRFPIE